MSEKPIIFSTPMVKVCPECGSKFERNGRHLTNWKRMIYCSRACSARSQSIKIDDSKVIRLFDKGCTSAEIADELGCSTAPVKKILTRHGLRRPAKPRPGLMSHDRNPSWSGGRRVRVDGYVVIWTPEGEQLEHRVIMEKHLCRKLTADEVIHHKDRNKQNNEIENLEVLSQQEHVERHLIEMANGRYGS